MLTLKIQEFIFAVTTVVSPMQVYKSRTGKVYQVNAQNDINFRAEQRQRIDDDEEIWNELQDETGFSSYEEYLHQSCQPTFSSLIVPQKCSMIDISRGEDSRLTTN